MGSHAGIIRLRVWPTTIEETQDALERLLAEVPDAELAGALVIIDRDAIRGPSDTVKLPALPRGASLIRMRNSL